MTSPTDGMLVEGAASIAARLAGEAVWHRRRCNWLGDAMEYVDDDWRVVHRACGVSLYDGTSGIALFLAHAAALTGDPIIADTARGALRQCLSQLDALPAPGRLGLYSGVPGVAYALAQCAELLAEEEWGAHASSLLDGLTPDGDDGAGLDVIGGAAGAIPLLLAIGTRHTIQLAESLGERLRRHGRWDGDLATWETLPGTPPLTGYSHGAAGIAVALHELAAATGESSWARLGDGALAYERRLFDPVQRNWPDLRQQHAGAADGGEAPRHFCASAWCHGAPGIALARLRLHEINGDPRAREEAVVALETTRAALRQAQQHPRADASYCHGIAGLAEPFLMAAESLADVQWRAEARQAAGTLLASYARPRAPWPCGVPNGGETPSLLTGLAGIGHFLLRVALPASVPSVLLLRGSAIAADARVVASHLELAAG